MPDANDAAIRASLRNAGVAPPEIEAIMLLPPSERDELLRMLGLQPANK